MKCECGKDYFYIYQMKEQTNVIGCVSCGYIERVVIDEEMDKLLSGPRPFEVIKCKESYYEAERYR